MPRGYIRFKFRISMPSLIFTFVNEFEQCLFIAEIKEQLANIELGKGVTMAIFSVYSLILKDCWTGS